MYGVALGEGNHDDREVKREDETTKIACCYRS